MNLFDKVTAKGTLKVLRHYGLKVFTDSSKNFNLNIVNIRSDATTSGKFDDIQIVVWMYDKTIKYMKFVVTTDPGIPYLLRPLNKHGAAIIVPGQYEGVWQLGKHKGQYDALIQVNPIDVYRDDDLDAIAKYITLEEVASDANYGFKINNGLFGINCHRASSIGIKEYVGYYSAGCVVHQDPIGYNKFINVCKESAINWGNIFTATWITETDYDTVINS